MSPTVNTNEEIIEKKASAPVATACLIIAAAALFGAILLQLIELGEYRTGIASADKDPAATKVTSDLRKLKDEVQGILDKTAAAVEGEAGQPDAKAGDAGAAEPGDAGAAEPGDAGAEAGAAPGADAKADEGAAAEPDADADTAEPAAEAAGDKAEPAAEEKAEEK